MNGEYPWERVNLISGFDWADFDEDAVSPIRRLGGVEFWRNDDDPVAARYQRACLTLAENTSIAISFGSVGGGCWP